MTIELPYPPTVNTYWRCVNNVMKISRKGRMYRRDIAVLLFNVTPNMGAITARIMAHPPDKRERDLDNILKALLDALAHGGAYDNDSQIKRIELEWGEIVRGGKVIVELTEYTTKPKRKSK